MTTIDALESLRESLDRDQQRFEQAAAALGPVRASDASGAVTVVLDPDGRVGEVTFAEHWPRHHDPGALGEVVTATCALAAGERMRAYLTAFAEADAVRRARPAPAGAEVAVGADPGASPEQMFSGLARLLDELEQSLADALLLVTQRQGDVVTGEGASGRVRAEVTRGGDVVGLQLDPAWSTRATPSRLGAEVTAAIADAQARSRRDDLATEITEASGLGRLAGLIRDPARLAAELAERPERPEPAGRREMLR